MNARTNDRGRADDWLATVTDTFAGEANFAWRRQYAFTTPAGASKRVVMRAAKAAAGFTGDAGTTERDGGDGYIFRPRGACVVMFVEWMGNNDEGTGS